MQLIVFHRNQTLTQQLGGQFIQLDGQLLVAPAEEQLGFQHRIERLNMAQQFLTGNAAVLSDDGCHQRRQHQHMRDVVTIVGHQHRLLARQNDDVPDGVLLNFELVHLQRVVDQLTGGGRRNGGIR
ncbi:hypothetical protein D3C76_988640 [compost metagenome]